jgi:hypothetical protein
MWQAGDNRPIHLKEAEALLKTLSAVPQLIKDKRVDARVDNMAVYHGWERVKARDPALNHILKQIAHHMNALNCDLRLCYIPSKDNPADAPSRRISLQDATLSGRLWEKVQSKFGPHTFDLMALDSNAQKDTKGHPRPHFTPYPLPNSSGVNVLAQTLSERENYYAFPPFCMVQPLINFLIKECSRPLSVSLVIPKLDPLPSWWPVLLQEGKLSLLAEKGEADTVNMPSVKGPIPSPLHIPLYLARLSLQ